MKIIFIEPKGTSALPHTGLAYLIGNLFNFSQHQTAVFDLNFLNWDLKRLSERVLAEKPDLIGLSVKSSNLIKAQEIAALLKEKTRAKFICGGPHITLCGREFMANDNFFDFAIQGEAENSFSKLIQTINDISTYQNIPGLIYRSINGELRVNQLELISDLDSLKFPIYDGFEGIDFNKTNYPLLTSRGCPYSCIYCSVGLVSGRQWRFRSPKNVVDEIKSSFNKYKFRRFEIVDDNFTLNIERAKEICRLLIKENLDLKWSCPNGLRADRLDEELIILMKKAGCQEVSIGIESGDKKVFDFIKKGESLEDIISAVNLLNKHKITTTGFFIVGLPYDSLTSTKKTIAFIDKLKLTGGAKWNLLIPYPKTKLWEWAENNGRWLADFTKGRHFSRDNEKIRPVFETKDFSAKERIRAYKIANLATGSYRYVFKIPRSKIFFYFKLIIYLIYYSPDLLIKKIINKIKKLFNF